MKYTKLFVLGFLVFGAVSCSSLDSDARKAAQLSRKSIECASKMEFDKAEKAYRQAQDIFRKYAENGQSNDFAQAYNKYLLEK